jgi:hypothetical protein
MTTMEQINDACRFMQTSVAFPEDVRARIASLRVPMEDGKDPRMNTNWRSGPGSSHGPSRVFPGHRPPAMGGGGGGGPGPRPRKPAPRFGNRGNAEASVEERMMDRIRDKMNKFSEATYEATKAWLSQLLDSGETDFLTDFITMVFEKAAMEKMFCPLYARLITELCGGFPHLRGELVRIFSEFIKVFEEANEPAKAGGGGEGPAYQSFLALRERRKYRRGYSAFLSEIGRLGVISTEDVLRTCSVIVESLIVAKGLEEQQLLCEEYADCLTVLTKSLALKSTDPIVGRVKLAMDRVGSPSLSNKARFALMDITDRIKG